VLSRRPGRRVHGLCEPTRAGGAATSAPRIARLWPMVGRSRRPGLHDCHSEAGRASLATSHSHRPAPGRGKRQADTKLIARVVKGTLRVRLWPPIWANHVAGFAVGLDGGVAVPGDSHDELTDLPRLICPSLVRVLPVP
jgi:hypothetical protein